MHRPFYRIIDFFSSVCILNPPTDVCKNFFNMCKTICNNICYSVCEIHYHERIRDTKQNFKENKSDLCVLCCKGRGETKGRYVKKNKVLVCCERNPFCPKPLASHRTSVIQLLLSKLVGFCLSLILCRSICYRALFLFCVKYFTVNKNTAWACLRSDFVFHEDCCCQQPHVYVVL